MDHDLLSSKPKDLVQLTQRQLEDKVDELFILVYGLMKYIDNTDRTITTTEIISKPRHLTDKRFAKVKELFDEYIERGQKDGSKKS